MRQENLKKLKQKEVELPRNARAHRLCTHGAMLEQYLSPDEFTTEQIELILKALFRRSDNLKMMSDVEQTEVAFLWKPYIPFGKLTILHGDAGNGKTYLAMQLCAACTNKAELPHMEVHEPFNVIYQTAEDGLGDTIKPRLIEAGADLEKVLVIDEGDDDPLTLADERIEKAIRQNDARLLIIDPIQAFLGPNVDMNRANEVRPILRKIGDVAQRTGCAIVLIGHLNKATGQQSGYRGLGSIDFTAGVRSVLVIGKSKDDPNVRVLAHDKSSLTPAGTSLAFMQKEYYRQLRSQYPFLIGNFMEIERDGYSIASPGKLAAESPLKLCGYSVSSASDLTERERHEVLVNMIYNGILSKTEIIEYLEHFKKFNGSSLKNCLAYDKWKRDLDFIRKLNIGKHPVVKISEVKSYHHFKKKKELQH